MAPIGNNQAASILRTSGSSIEEWIKRFTDAKACFLDKEWKWSNEFLWNNSSPQHIDGRSLARLFPADFLADALGIMRDPMSRLNSAFDMQYRIRGHASVHRDVNEFVDFLHGYRMHLANGFLDNHFLPQSQFLYPGRTYSLFLYSQSGFKAAEEYLKNLFCVSNEGAVLPHENKPTALMNGSIRSELDRSLGSTSRRLLEEIYASDFEIVNRFSGKPHLTMNG